MKKCVIVGVSILVLTLGLSVIKRPDYFDCICRLVGFTDTVYAEGFTRAKFSRVTLGMSRTQVDALLGRGFRTFTVIPCDSSGTLDQERWFYSSGAANHWRFWITFDTNDKVSQIQREFWRD